MSAPGLTIPTSFTANGDYVNNVNRMTNSTDRLLGSLSRLNTVGSKLGLSDQTKNILSYAKSALLVGGVAATFRYSTEAVTGYETAIQSLQAVTGASDGQMVGFKKEIKEVGDTSKKSMTDIAASFETVGSAMSQYLGDPKALRSITEAGVILSKASRMQLQPSLEALTSVMNQFQLGAEKANKTVQTLTAGEIVGAVRTADAANMLQEFGAVAKNMNVNVGESVALIEALGMQMDKTKIGVGARNILTAISAAGGLDKKARQDMTKAGVDMKYLMDTSHSLSDRLHELSKIAKDPIKMISVFGKENVTAASVIFNQLGTYDKFYNTIQKTNEAEHQAAVNSRTLAVAWDQMKNKWSNFLNSSEDVGSILDKTRNSLLFLSDNMEGIISVGLKAVTMWALWKGAIVATRVALGISSVAMGIQNALMLQSITLVEGNMVAKTASIVTEKAMAVAIAISTGNWAALNAMMLANPAFLIVAGLTAVAGALYLANQRSKELTETYKKQLDLDTAKHVDNESAAVKKLATEYYLLYGNIQKATTEAIKFRLAMIDSQRAAVEQRINKTKKDLAEEKYKAYLGDFFLSGGINNKPMYGKRADLAAQLAEQQSTALGLSANKSSELQFLQSQVGNGNVNKKDFAGYFNGSQAKKPEWEMKAFGDERGGGGSGFNMSDLQSLLFEGKQKVEIIVSNQSQSPAMVKSGTSKGTSVMPGLNSSFDIK